MRLVVNADDLGLHPALDAGILRAHREGVVTSATLLAAGASAPEAVRAARAQGLAVGVHLALCGGLPSAAPAAEVPGVASAPGGRLPRGWADVARAWVRGRLPAAQVERELRAQVARARALGAAVDHLDAHQHLHLLPGVAAVVARLARDEGLPLRWPKERPHPTWLRRPGPALKSALLGLLALRRPPGPALRAVGVFEAGALDEPTLLALLARLPDGDWELGCHPGAEAVVVPEDPAWRYGWTAELAALTSPRVRAALEARGVELTTYGALFGPRAAG